MLVHILQGDLILHKRTLEPIKTVIYGLRRYDIDRVLALREHHDPTVKVEGYMSHKSKIYLVRALTTYLIPSKRDADDEYCRPTFTTTWSTS